MRQRLKADAFSPARSCVRAGLRRLVLADGFIRVGFFADECDVALAANHVRVLLAAGAPPVGGEMTQRELQPCSLLDGDKNLGHAMKILLDRSPCRLDRGDVPGSDAKVVNGRQAELVAKAEMQTEIREGSRPTASLMSPGADIVNVWNHGEPGMLTTKNMQSVWSSAV